VGAVAQPDNLNDVASGRAMAGIAQTDSAGRFRLENIPPGRYYIAAGRLDQQTYYPGALDMARATAILITKGGVVSDIDFVMRDASDTVYVQTDSVTIPLRVRVEGDGKAPVFSSAGFAMVRVTRSTDGVRTDYPLIASGITVYRTAAPVTSVNILTENLPPGYAVTSIRYGPVDLQKNPLSVPIEDFRTRATGFSSVNTPFGAFSPISSGAMATSPTGIDITLSQQRRPAGPGVRVSGTIKGAEGRSIYISGKPGTLYADGSFELQEVPPGRHLLATLDNPTTSRPLGAVITVGDRDVEGVELTEISLLPSDSRSAPVRPVLAPPKSASALPSLHGRVVDEMTQEPFNAGSVTLKGDTVADFKLDDAGRFEIPRLLPGVYELLVNVYAVGSINRKVEIDSDDVTLDLSLH
jgi:hypothetical protein